MWSAGGGGTEDPGGGKPHPGTHSAYRAQQRQETGHSVQQSVLARPGNLRGAKRRCAGPPETFLGPAHRSQTRARAASREVKAGGRSRSRERRPWPRPLDLGLGAEGAGPNTCSHPLSQFMDSVPPMPEPRVKWAGPGLQALVPHFAHGWGFFRVCRVGHSW